MNELPSSSSDVEKDVNYDGVETLSKPPNFGIKQGIILLALGFAILSGLWFVKLRQTASNNIQTSNRTPTSSVPDKPDQISTLQRTSGPNSPRKTGNVIFYERTIKFCGPLDGTISEEYNEGQPTGVKFLSSHIDEVSSNSITVVGPSGNVESYPLESVFIITNPGDFWETQGSYNDLEAGDCVWVWDAETQGPYTVLVVK